MHRKSRRTGFGEEVARFSFERNIPLTLLARACGVSCESLRSVMYGRTPGPELTRRVRGWMAGRDPVRTEPPRRGGDAGAACGCCGRAIDPLERTARTFMGALCETCLDKADQCAPKEEGENHAIDADDDP